jgi:Integrase core domain
MSPFSVLPLFLSRVFFLEKVRARKLQELRFPSRSTYGPTASLCFAGLVRSAAQGGTPVPSLSVPRFQDRSAAAVYATLLDEGEYHCSIRTMYRLLEQCGESRERRDQLTHPPYQKPELMATAPNQLWSWDITKLLGPAKWTYFYLYVILDVFSRYVAGWMVAYRESAELAKRNASSPVNSRSMPIVAPR